MNVSLLSKKEMVNVIKKITNAQQTTTCKAAHANDLIFVISLQRSTIHISLNRLIANPKGENGMGGNPVNPFTNSLYNTVGWMSRGEREKKSSTCSWHNKVGCWNKAMGSGNPGYDATLCSMAMNYAITKPRYLDHRDTSFTLLSLMRWMGLTKMDSLKAVVPQHTLYLENYQVLNSIKHPYTFMLAANDKTSCVDFFLKADTEQELEGWIHALQTTTKSVLEKWIERADDMRPTAMQRRNNYSTSSNSSYISNTTTTPTATAYSHPIIHCALWWACI